MPKSSAEQCPVQGGEGDAHARHDALKDALARVDVTPLGLADPLLGESRCVFRSNPAMDSDVKAAALPG
ncbi:MAG TPA: hypothetical protein VKY89_09825 [Thermoanaerobaculia bacterium]|nr:hypothetical protein [Thermoanaerobaculia bacterium]